MYSFEGRRPSPALLDRVRQGEVGAICLFRALNVESPAQVAALTAAIQAAAREGGQPTPLIGIDQEGGQLVAIAEGATELPGNMALGATRSPALAEAAGKLCGLELLAMGINMNFAPSLDVNVNPANPVIGARSFGDNPQAVAALGTAYIRGLQSVGVLATAKHFPGHGDTMTDTHYSMPIVPHSLERMESVELAPFRAAIQAGVGAVMTAHLLFPAMDADQPATLSQRILTDFLRRDMGFNGLIVTDAMDMHAVAQFGPEASVRAALHAGADLILLGHLTGQAAFGERLAPMANPDGVARVLNVRRQLPITQPSLDVVGSTAHLAIAQQIADQSITLVRHGPNFPLRPAPDDEIAVITPRPVDLTPADTSSAVNLTLADRIRARHAHVSAYQLPPQATPAAIREVLTAVEGAQTVIIGTINASGDPSQVALVQALWARGQMPLVVALRTPYDLLAFPEVDTYMCAYGIRAVTMEAVARVLFGEIEAQGVLPCAIPGLVG